MMSRVCYGNWPTDQCMVNGVNGFPELTKSDGKAFDERFFVFAGYLLPLKSICFFFLSYMDQNIFTVKSRRFHEHPLNSP